MSWNLENLRVKAVYLETFPVQGVVELSRVAYGGRVVHTLVLDNPITVFGALRDRVIVENESIQQVSDNT